MLTSLGNLTVRLPMPVPPNANLQLQVVGTGPNMQLRILSVNGQPVSPGLASPVADVRAGGLPGIVGPASGGATAGPIQMGIAGQPAAAGNAPPLFDVPPATPTGGLAATIVFGTEPGLPNGTQLTVRLLDLGPPTALGASDGTVAPTGLPEPAGTPAAMPGTGVPLAPGASPAPGEPGVTAQNGPGTATASPGGTTAILPDATGAPETPSAATTLNPEPTATTAALGTTTVPATLPGVVAPNSLAGRTLLQTPIGLISLDAGPDLTAGSHVLLETIGAPQLPAPAAASQNQPGQSARATGWATFTDAMAVLQKADPAAAAALVERLPDFGPQFVPNMATWIAAANTGDMRGWIGDRAIKALEKAGRSDLIAKLEGDMGEMRAPVSLPQTASQWQVLTIPLFFGQQIERVRMTVRRNKGDDEEEGREEEGTRFLVDIDMSRLGALQFDGLIKRQTKRFDLIVRSRLELPDQVRSDISGIFARSLEGLGMTGNSIFKTAAAFVEPIPASPIPNGLMI